MSTTALRIELLIIGFQASIWFLLFFGIDVSVDFYIRNASAIKDTAAVLVLAVLAWCYSLGAIVDGFTAVLEDPMSFITKTASPTKESSVMRLKFSDAYKELISSDFELRLLRSTAFNLIIIGVSTWASFSFSSVVVGIFIAGIMVGAAWFRRKRRSERRRESLYAKAEELAAKE